MSEPELLFSFLTKLNALTGGVFLLCAFGLVAIRQMLTCLRLYVFQSLLFIICFKRPGIDGFKADV